MNQNLHMQSQCWHNTSVVRMQSVVPASGFGTGAVRLDAFGYASDASNLKRHADAIKATPATGFQPWSPPV